MPIEWQFGAHEYINELIKLDFKIRQSKIALKETPILKLGVTLVLTESQVYVFVILHQDACMPSYHKSFNKDSSLMKAPFRQETNFSSSKASHINNF